jgi:hypothetical protein
MATVAAAQLALITASSGSCIPIVMSVTSEEWLICTCLHPSALNRIKTTKAVAAAAAHVTKRTSIAAVKQ